MGSVLHSLLRFTRTCAPWVLAVVMCLSALGVHEHLHGGHPQVATCTDHDHGDQQGCDVAECTCPAPAAVIAEVNLPAADGPEHRLLHRVTDHFPPPQPLICPDPPPAQRT